MSHEHPDPLEQFVQRALRELPAERAPADLEARVLTALATRRRAAATAGWRSWPAVPRTAVLAAATATALVVAWCFLAGTQFVETFAWTAWLQERAPWVTALGSAGATLVDALALCVRKFQPWLLGLGAVVALAYAALFSLGSGLYRRLVATS